MIVANQAHMSMAANQSQKSGTQLLTTGQEYEKVFLLGSVPSTVATAVYRSHSLRNRGRYGEEQNRRTGQESHVYVVSRHEFDIHSLPKAGCVDIPINRTGLPLDEDIARTGAGRVGIGTNVSDSGGEKCQDERDKYGEHDSGCQRALLYGNGASNFRGRLKKQPYERQRTCASTKTHFARGTDKERGRNEW